MTQTLHEETVHPNRRSLSSSTLMMNRFLGNGRRHSDWLIEKLTTSDAELRRIESWIMDFPFSAEEFDQQYKKLTHMIALEIGQPEDHSVTMNLAEECMLSIYCS